MSNREHQVTTQIGSFRGVNERMEATLLDTSLVSNSRGIYFGLDGVASRIEGKLFAGILPFPVINFHQFGDRVLIQTTENLQILNLSDLLAGTFVTLPGTPDAPILISAGVTSITVETPAAVTDAVSYNLEMAIGLGSFATLQIGTTPETEYTATGLSPLTPHYFRVIAINADGSKAGATLTTSTDLPAYLVSDTNPEDRIVSDTVTDPVTYLYTDNV